MRTLTKIEGDSDVGTLRAPPALSQAAVWHFLLAPCRQVGVEFILAALSVFVQT